MRQFKLSIKSIKKAALCIGAAFLFLNCSEKTDSDLGPINRNFSDRTTFNAHVTYKDSGVVRLDLRAPIIEEYTLIDSPYTVMQKGVKVHFWNSNNPKPNFLRADWAKIQDGKDLYEGKGNVMMINNDGDTLRTQHITWDKRNRRIFTKDTVTIFTARGDELIAKNGLDASEDFKTFVFYDNHGVYSIDSTETTATPTSPTSLDMSPQKEKNNVPLEFEKDINK